MQPPFWLHDLRPAFLFPDGTISSFRIPGLCPSTQLASPAKHNSTKIGELMSDVFVSYASEDRDKARQLAQVIEAEGWSVWWDRQIPAGKTYDTVIEEALISARCVVVVWSENSIRKTWVKTEANEGLQRNILLPVIIADVEQPLAFRYLQAADLRGWDGTGSSPIFRKMVEDLKVIIEAGSDWQGGEERSALGALPKKVTPHQFAAETQQKLPLFQSRRIITSVAVTVLLLIMAAGYFRLKPKPQPSTVIKQQQAPIMIAAIPKPPILSRDTPQTTKPNKSHIQKSTLNVTTPKPAPTPEPPPISPPNPKPPSYTVKTSEDRTTIILANSSGEEQKFIPLGQDRVQKIFNAPNGKWSLIVCKVRNQQQFFAFAVDLKSGEQQKTLEIPSAPQNVAFEREEVVMNFAGGDRQRFTIR
jgi:hypothetical protein